MRLKAGRSSYDIRLDIHSVEQVILVRGRLSYPLRRTPSGIIRDDWAPKPFAQPTEWAYEPIGRVLSVYPPPDRAYLLRVVVTRVELL